MADWKKFGILGLTFLVLSCNKVEKIYLLPERNEIVTALKKKINNDQVFSVEALNDGEAYFPEYNSTPFGKMSLADTFVTDFSNIKIGRIISRIDTTLLLDVKWDSAYAHLQYRLRGKLKIVQMDDVVDSTVDIITYDTITQSDTVDLSIDSSYVDSLSSYTYDTSYVVETSIDTVDSTITWKYTTLFSPVDSSSTNFNHRGQQKAVFLRTQNSNNPDKDWKLQLVTPVIFDNPYSSPTLQKVVLSSNGSPSALTFPETDDQDMLNCYLVRDSLPELTYNAQLTFDGVTVDNSDPYPQEPGELVLIHFGQGINIYKKRLALSDEGNNQIHTGSLTINSRGENVYGLFIDVIDYRTIFIKESDYRGQIWMIPFQVP